VRTLASYPFGKSRQNCVSRPPASSRKVDRGSSAPGTDEKLQVTRSDTQLKSPGDCRPATDWGGFPPSHKKEDCIIKIISLESGLPGRPLLIPGRKVEKKNGACRLGNKASFSETGAFKKQGIRGGLITAESERARHHQNFLTDSPRKGFVTRSMCE